MKTSKSRRPISQRDSVWAGNIAAWLSRLGVTPNQVSIASMVFAALAGGLFYLAPGFEAQWRAVLLILAAAACQCRLLCNLFDGMIAVEGGKAEADGPFWNEFPDRVSDFFILAGAGYGAGVPEIGLAAAALAIMTAYVRELGRAIGQLPDFSGPMAKPARMHLVSLGGVAAAFDPVWATAFGSLAIAITLILLGTALTVLNRSRRLIRDLNDHVRERR